MKNSYSLSQSVLCPVPRLWYICDLKNPAIFLVVLIYPPIILKNYAIMLGSESMKLHSCG